jgi:hypothetical protein
MRKIFLCTLVTLTLSGCLEKSEENLQPPPKLVAVPYKVIVPDFAMQNSGSSASITIKATQCLPLYYDKPLLRINCYLDGDWVRKNDGWEYKGKNVVFAGLVKAYYRESH